MIERVAPLVLDPLLLRATSVPYQIRLHWLMAGHATSGSALDLYVFVEAHRME